MILIGSTTSSVHSTSSQRTGWDSGTIDCFVVSREHAFLISESSQILVLVRMWRYSFPTISIFLSITGIILEDGPIHDVPQLCVHVDGDLVADTHEQIHKEGALPTHGIICAYMH